MNYTRHTIAQEWIESEFLCGTEFPGEVAVSEGDYPIAIYLGPSQLTAARYTESNEPVLIANVKANQEWKDYITLMATKGLGLPHDQRSDPLSLKKIFLPTLSQIVQALTTNLKLPISEITLGPILFHPSLQSQIDIMWELIHNNSIPNSPQYRQIDLPSIKHYGFYGMLLRLPAYRAAPIAYNLITPGGAYDNQLLNPLLWPERPRKVVPIEEHQYQRDPAFMLYVDFEPSFLYLKLVALEDMAETPQASTVSVSAGADNLFTSSETNLPVSPPGAVRILVALIYDFVAKHATPAELNDLRAVILVGGAGEKEMEVMRTALLSLYSEGEIFEGRRMEIDIDPAYVPALGGAVWVLQREYLIRRDLKRIRQQELAGNKEL